MNIENTTLNLLTFSKPTQSLTFYFADQPIDKGIKLHFTNYPAGIEQLFPGITSDKERQLYTTFDYKTSEGNPLPIHFVPENYGLLKRFYNNNINYYFRKLKGKIVKVDYVKDNQVWLQQPSPNENAFLLYDRYTLKVQFCQVSALPELVISYDGQSKIMTKALPLFLQDVDPADVVWVQYRQSVLNYHQLVKEGFSDFGNCYPVLNNNIRNLLEMPVDLSPRGNRYLRYHKKISDFITDWLDTDQFRELIPLNSAELQRISPSKVSITRPESNLLLFGKNVTGQVPMKGLSNNGPFAVPPHSRIHLFYIMHEDDAKYSIPFNSALLNSDGKNSFRGLHDFAGVMAYQEKGFSIVFKDRENPLPEVKKALADKNLNPDNRYIAIYLTPWPKTDPSPSRHRIYFLMKELLLKYRITMQGIDVQKIKNLNDNFKYSLVNIALAMLAKLDGTPWRLNATLKNELVIGIGAFSQASGVKYLGSAFSFDNQGKLNQFEYFLKNETRLLAGSIKTAVREFTTRRQGAQRLIIHFYKTMSEKEIRPIEEALNNLGLNIPVFVIAINKTESEQLIAFDSGSEQLMPVSGTYINIGRNQYLLFNNTRYPGMPHKASDGYPFPVKLSLQCNRPELLSDTSITGDLIDQVYQFSRLYYKSVRQQPLPITIKYPEMLAGIAPNFHDQVIPPFGKDNLWFL